MKIDPEFKKDILYLDLATIEESEDVIYIVDSAFFLKAYNSMWEKFAHDNNGEEVLRRYPLGSSIHDAFLEPIKSYLIRAYTAALQDNTPFEQTYECPSPLEYRLYRQTAYPLVQSRGLVITNHLVRKSQLREEIVAFSKQFVDKREIITQCQNCRKIRDPQNEQRWLWVPSLVKNTLANISHGICPQCLDHYFPDIDKEM
ncbi:MAG TPA: hypothetical protein VJ969_12130 [Desulfopila sp.]|nr:hypothetical protein [Desulfopila sp.]